MSRVKCPYCQTVFDAPEEDDVTIFRRITPSTFQQKRVVKCPNCKKYVEY